MSSSERTDILIKPYGGELVNLLVPEEEREDVHLRAASLPRVQLTARNVCDLELLATGGFSPLSRIRSRADYNRVLEELRLASGMLFPLPVTLTVKKDAGVKLDGELALADQHNNVLAVMRVEEIFKRDAEPKRRLSWRTITLRQPLLEEKDSAGELCVSEDMRVIQLPRYYDFRTLRLTPAAVREKLAALGHANVVAFQTRNPLHPAHEELTVR